ncbi:heparan sulfate 2-O-sulfotransferase pipe isoform X4 [Drosophila mojavensis]|uniref:heparan sulfate 2-O-sulfotransferase pipe isoform X4 n=1 Tax=Drosophila mojavensis TaxID=7230 RepID=UPI001CD09627|nr:heparan sulfate 2-O-sulfotransferase pipe isoform X4 [Drosophila mojavensis]
MSLNTDRSYKMKLRDVENAFKYRRIPYPKRSVELIALLAISCTFFLFMHTNKLNSRLKEMEVKLQPSEFSALGLTGNHISGHDAGKHDDINTLHGTYQYLKSTGQLVNVTTLRQNNTRRARRRVVFFNRPTRVGTELMLPLLSLLSKHNDVNLVLKGPVRKKSLMRTAKQERIETRFVSRLENGSLYVAHGNWIDFAEYNRRKPIYISLVRDPVERMLDNYYQQRTLKKQIISRNIYPAYPQHPDAWYKQSFSECVRRASPECQYIEYSMRDEVEDFKRQSLFFCGNDIDCLPFNTRYGVQKAKRNVEKEYSVVGTWEQPNITLTVLEKYVPRYFNHALTLFNLHKQSYSTFRRYAVDADVWAMVRRNFSREYDFYNFCKQRLYKQYLALKLEKSLN